MKVVLDANCFIDSLNPAVECSRCMKLIFSARDTGRLDLNVSRQTLDELSKKPDLAYELAKKLPVLPYWPFGSIADLVGTIEQLSGTWEDARQNDEINEQLRLLAKSGSSIRDRGAYIDALRAKADVFLTSDTHLVASGPAQRIAENFGLRVLTPCDLVREISKKLKMLRQDETA